MESLICCGFIKASANERCGFIRLCHSDDMDYVCLRSSSDHHISSNTRCNHFRTLTQSSHSLDTTMIIHHLSRLWTGLMRQNTNLYMLVGLLLLIFVTPATCSGHMTMLSSGSRTCQLRGKSNIHTDQLENLFVFKSK